MKICKQCNIEYEDNMKFCPECGSKLETKLNVCPNCGKEYINGQKFCSECGYKLMSTANEKTVSNDAEVMLQKGLAISKNREATLEEKREAVKYFNLAAEKGSIDAFIKLGECYEYARGVERDGTKAIEWYTKAVKAGSIDALNRLGYLYRYGLCVEEDTSKAIEWFTKAAKAGSIGAMDMLGSCYSYGDCADEYKSIEWYTKAAEKGNINSFLPLADEYKKIGNHEEALKCYKKATETGTSISYRRLADYYLECTDSNVEEAVTLYKKAADLGDYDAYCNLGNLYFKGEYVEQNINNAICWFKKGYENAIFGCDEIDSMNRPCFLIKLGDCYFNLKDYLSSYQYYRKAASSDYKLIKEEAHYILDKYFYSNGTVKEEITKVDNLIHKAESGNVEAKYELAQLYYSGTDLIKKNKEKANELYKEAAESGHGDAMYALWKLIIEDFIWLGEDFDFDDDEDEEEYEEEKNEVENNKIWLIKAVEAGHIEASYELADYYIHGDYGFEKSIEKALEIMEKTADKGNAESMYRLGRIYQCNPIELGLSKWKSECVARDWYEKASELGHAHAQYKLGCIYNRLALKDDLLKAAVFYEKAAKQGHKDAQEELANYYSLGKGVEKNLYLSYMWFEKAAAAGKIYSQYRTGCCYYYGTGVNRDLDKAEMWFEKAAEQGDEESEKMLEKIKQDKARDVECAKNSTSVACNHSIDKCIPYVFFIQSLGFDIVCPDGRGQQMKCGVGGDCSSWSGTGFLLADGRFVTARHVVEPWAFPSNGGEIDENMVALNAIANNGGKVVAKFVAMSSNGTKIQFTSEQCIINRQNDKVQLTDNGTKIIVASIDQTDYAYFKGGHTIGLSHNDTVSTSLTRETKLVVLGFPLGIGANSADDITPIYGSGVVAVNGLQNGVILTTDTNYEQGNSGGPVFKANSNGDLEVIGLVSAGAGRTMGFIVPIAVVK